MIPEPFRADVPQPVLDDPRARLARTRWPDGDILPVPCAWGEHWLNLVHRTEAPRGGHFPAREQPDLLCADIRTFAGALH